MSEQAPMIGAWYISLFNYKANSSREISFSKNEYFQLMHAEDAWWVVRAQDSSVGNAPASHFTRYTGPNPNGQNGVNAKERYAIAIYPYSAKLEDELMLNVRDKIRILDRADDGWWFGSLAGKEGWFPCNFVKEIVTDSDSQPSSEKYFIHGVKAKFNFDTGNPDELSFNRGELMDVIDKPPADPEWWQAMKADGSVGLIPSNYVEILENSTPIRAELAPGKPQSVPSGDPDIVLRPFYHKIQRPQAEALLKNSGRNGDFIVRNAAKEGCYSLSVMAPDRIRHFQIEKNNGMYTIGPRLFPTFQELFDHYKTSPILTAANGEKYSLMNGISSS